MRSGVSSTGRPSSRCCASSPPGPRPSATAYWRLVLHYCRQGNLQAVLDEQWHLLREQDSWSEDVGADETAAKCARKLGPVVHPARARVHAELFRAERGASGATVERDAIRVRIVFALRFGHGRTDDGEHIFGQPRQEELVTLLDRAGVDVARLRAGRWIWRR